jgi:hypothetical protein
MAAAFGVLLSTSLILELPIHRIQQIREIANTALDRETNLSVG